MENLVIPLSEQFKAIHPETGKLVKVVGIDMTSVFSPKLIILVTGPEGTWIETAEHVKNVLH